VASVKNLPTERSDTDGLLKSLHITQHACKNYMQK